MSHAVRFNTQCHAVIEAVDYYLPGSVLTNDELSIQFPDWEVEKLSCKTGISARHVAENHQCASDLAFAAAERLFASARCKRHEIDYLLLCTQCPDYLLPPTSCLLHQRLGLSKSCASLDVNHGCSGFVYGLGLAEALIASRQATSVLLLTADTYSRYISSNDRSCRMIFGDGAAATLLRVQSTTSPSIGPFVYGTDGGGAEDIILPNSACRLDSSETGRFLRMKGNKVFQFVLQTVPPTVNQLLDATGIAVDDVSLFVFHQANAYLLEALRSTMGLPANKVLIDLREHANTVSSTIPIALKNAMASRRIEDGSILVLVGFGVGLSWAATIVRWRAMDASGL